MMSVETLPEALLKRKAVVYVRQSTQTQVQKNLESQRRLYDLVEVARRYGFASIEVIDDDLGRSASGSVARPGFDKLVATVCAGEVGAVLCLDASRLAAMAETGITCSSCVASSAPESPTRTAFTIPIDPMIDYCSG
jgi:DNA invertase Pin-like site-specific DNA recombinase